LNKSKSNACAASQPASQVHAKTESNRGNPRLAYYYTSPQFYLGLISSAVRRAVPVRMFGDWTDPPPGFVEVDFVAHAGTSAAGSFVQTMVLTDIATGWTECLPLVARSSALVIEALARRNDALPVFHCVALTLTMTVCS
jgi:hypothetical protein